MKKFLNTLLMFAGLCAVGADQVVNIPQVADHWIREDILTRQSSPAWSFGAVLRGFVQLKNPSADAVKDTQVRMFHDGKKLYFGFFRTVDTTSLCNVAERDGIVWGDDSVFLFVAPDAAKPEKFFQIIINAKGAVYDEEVNKDGMSFPKKNFNSLKYNIFPGVHGWLLYASVDLAELEIAPGKEFLLNAASHRKESSGEEEYSTFAPMRKPSFVRPEDFVRASLGKVAKKPPVYSFAQTPELCLDGEVEFGTNERWHDRAEAAASKYYKISGTNSIYVECKAGKTHANWFHDLDLAPETRYRISFMCRYWSCETPDLKPVRIHCYGTDGKLIRTLYGPGIGNMGGSAPNHRFAPFAGEVVTPPGTVKSVLEVRVDKPGKIHIDALSVRRYTPVNHVPEARYPVNDAVLRTSKVGFRWQLFSRDNMRLGDVTVECSQDRSFPKDQTLVFDGCAYDPGQKNRCWYEELPAQGKWFWRAKFTGENGGVWSKTASFVIDYDKTNEKIAPVIGDMFPRGRMRKRPAEIRIPFSDGAVSSGIGSVKLLVNRQDITSSAKVDGNGISFLLPDDGRTFYDIHLTVADNNRNRAEGNDFIFISPDKGKVTVDGEGFLAVDGKRFFPVFTYAYGDIRQVPEIARRGYNGNLGQWIEIGESRFWRLLAQYTDHGLRMIPFTEPDYICMKGLVKSDSRAVKRFMAENMKAIAKLQGHPGVLGIYIGDESIDRGFRMDVFQEYYRAIRKAAPDLPVSWLPTYGQTNSFAWIGAPQACDILFHDDYVAQRNQHLNMFKDIARILNWTKNYPFIELIGAHARSNEWKKKERWLPSYQDLRYCIWASIAAGSRGIAIYIQPEARDFKSGDVPTEYFDTIDRVLDEVRQAIPFLTGGGSPAKKAAVVSGEVKILEKELNGKTLTVTVNGGDDPARVKLGSGKVVELPRLGVEVIYY